ncbi:MAG: hypothetical protein GX184_06370 [Clostridiaceae bacterium]|nr:hypothetical protein [Clostridiaceae bacterium]
MYKAVFVLLIFLVFLAGSILLQVFLSKKKNKWLGLIIPLICFIFSIVAVLSMAMYSDITITSVTDTVSGSKLTETIVQSEKPGTFSMLLTALPVFIITNIPTVIFSAIYLSCREKFKLRNELDRMNIQDLE